jgi:hypothetical protein
VPERRAATQASASHGGGYYVVSPNDRSQNQAARLFTRWLFEQAEEQMGRAAG